MNEVTNERILERLVESDAGKQAAAAILREATAERMNLQCDIERMKRERGEERARLNAGTEAKRAALETARAALTEAEAAYNGAAHREAQTLAGYDARIAKLERKLAATAPSSIAELLRWLDDQADEVRATEISERSKRTNKINTHTSEPVREYWSNAASLRERLDGIRAATAEAEKLKSRVLSDDVLAERLQALRNGLPEIEMRFSHER